MRVESAEGVLVVYDAVAPPGVEQGCLGFLVYFTSKKDGEQHLFGSVIDTEAELADVLQKLGDELGVDLDALAEADSRINDALTIEASLAVGRRSMRGLARTTKSAGSRRESSRWEPSGVERAAVIMGYDPSDVLEDDDVVAQACGPCAASLPPPEHCGSPRGLYEEASRVAQACCNGPEGSPPPCTGPCCRSTNPCCPFCCGDVDCDGIPNGSDPDIDGDDLPNESDPDADGDQLPNGNDPDIDNDDIPNENDPNMDGDEYPNESDPNTDGDDLPDGEDPSPGGCTSGCCGSTNPCCGNPNPCCGNPNPCCGNPNPCCGSTDPCCDSADPCCGSLDPCCGSTDPCCGSTDPCCGNPDPCCGSTDSCCGNPDPCCGNTCDDQDPCTDDACDGGCVHEPKDCDDGNRCTADECVGGSCQNTLVECGDCSACDPEAFLSQQLCEPLCRCPTDPFGPPPGTKVLDDKCAACSGSGVEIPTGCSATGDCYREDTVVPAIQGEEFYTGEGDIICGNCGGCPDDPPSLPRDCGGSVNSCYTSTVTFNMSGGLDLDFLLIEQKLTVGLGYSAGTQLCIGGACTVHAAPCEQIHDHFRILARQGDVSTVTHKWSVYQVHTSASSPGCGSCGIFLATCATGESQAMGSVGVGVDCQTISHTGCGSPPENP